MSRTARTFERLQDDVRQVDADDVGAVGGQLIHLRPQQAAAGIEGHLAVVASDLSTGRTSSRN